MFDFIFQSIFAFKYNFPKGYVLVVVPEDMVNNAENPFPYYKLAIKSDLIVATNKERMEEQIPRLYGIIRNEMLVVLIKPTKKIEEVARNICTAEHNFILNI